MPADADFFTKITASIWDMIITYNNDFASVGSLIYAGLVLYRLVDFFKKLGFNGKGPGWENDLFDLLLLIVVVGLCLTFYRTPIPGVGYSFTQLVTGTSSGLARTLDKGLMQNMYKQWQAIQDSYVEPDGSWLVSAGLYLIMTVVLLLAKAFTMAAVSLSLIFSALAVLLGPLFVPWALLPAGLGYFKSWFSSLLQWSFLQVSAYGYLFIFENFMRTYLTSLPTDIPPEQLPTYGAQSTTIAIVFLVGLLFVGVFNAGLFSGGNSPTVLDHSKLRRYF